MVSKYSQLINYQFPADHILINRYKPHIKSSISSYLNNPTFLLQFHPTE